MLTSGHLSNGGTQTSGCVNSVVSPQLQQCGGCSCSCGQRVGCSRLSAPRTAANSNTLHCPPDPWILCPLFLSSRGQVLEHSTPCWSPRYMLYNPMEIKQIINLLFIYKFIVIRLLLMLLFFLTLTLLLLVELLLLLLL